MKILNELKLALYNEKFINKSRLSLTAFSRQRSLPFGVIVMFILQKSNHSLQICLDDFFSNVGKVVTKSAFCQARRGLCYKLFKRLNLLIISVFYQDASFKKWRSFRVLSVDGSTLRLPTHSSLAEKFSKHEFGAKRSVTHWMTRISYLFDVFNGVIIDAQMESFDTSEATLCKQHLPFVKKGDLLLFDRYYASYELMALLMSKGANFVFRMRNHSWNCVEEFINSNLKDQVVYLKLPHKCRYLLKTHHQLEDKIAVRLVKHVNRKREVKVFATSLLDTSYSKASIISLYRQRWNIEEAYKLIKARLDVAQFSGKTLEAVQQDFYAKTLLLSLSAVLRSGIRIPKSSVKKTKKKPERTAIVNASYSLNQCKRLIIGLFEKSKSLKELIEWFLKRVGPRIEYSRKGQANPRKKNKGYDRKISMSYKPV